MNPIEVWFHPSAEDEADEIFEWYFARSPVAAVSFRSQLDRAISLIAEAPARPPAYLYGTRRVKVRISLSWSSTGFSRMASKQDVQAGHLDGLAKQALQDYAEGRTTPF